MGNVVRAYLVLLAIAVAWPAVAATKVVAIGDTSPIGGTFDAVGGISPILLGTNAKGDVLFWSGVRGGSSSVGIFLFSNGSSDPPAKIVAERDTTPIQGTFDQLSPSFGAYRLNSRGDVAFVASVSGGQSEAGVFLFSGGSLSKVVAWGDQAPSPYLIEPTTSPDIFVPTSGFSIDLNDDGEVMFFTMQGKRVGSSYVSRGGIYLSAGGAPSRILTSGVDTEIGTLFLTDGILLGPYANNNRQFVLWGTTNRTDEAIFLCGSGSCRKVIAVGDPIPGGSWPRHSGPCCIVGFNDAGRVGLQGLSPRGEVLIWAGGAFITDVAPGYTVIDPTPGALDGIFNTLADRRPINRYGEFAFSGATDQPGENRYGVFTLSDSNLRKPVSAGDPAPSQGSFTNFGAVTVNNDACVAFEANTTGPSGFYYSIWQSDTQAVTMAKARKFFEDLDAHTRFNREGQGDVLLRQIYGAGLSTAELVARVSNDMFDSFGAYADKSIKIRILDSHGRSVPAADRTDLVNQRNALRDARVFERLSFLQLELLRRNFKTCDGKIDFGKLRRGFEMFANGETRTGVPGQREMDQLHQWLLWAEFAESAITVGQDADSWGKILPAQVTGLEIYRQVYPAPPLGPDADPIDKLYGELLRSDASRFDPSRQLTEQQKRDLRNTIDALTPEQLRDRLRMKIAEMTIAEQDALPKAVEFASATAEPFGDGFNIGVRARISDGGTPVNDAIVRLLVRDLGIAVPQGAFHFSSNGTPVGGGEYTWSFFVPAPPVGVTMMAFEESSLAAQGTSLLLNSPPALTVSISE